MNDIITKLQQISEHDMKITDTELEKIKSIMPLLDTIISNKRKQSEPTEQKQKQKPTKPPKVKNEIEEKESKLLKEKSLKEKKSKKHEIVEKELLESIDSETKKMDEKDEIKQIEKKQKREKNKSVEMNTLDKDKDTVNETKEIKDIDPIKPIQLDTKSQTSSLEYLRNWNTDKKAWKFEKIKQIWLLTHTYSEKINDMDFEILVRYMVGLKGGARDNSLNKANEMLKNEPANKRALKIISILNE